jgi:hypothetical protein
MSVATAEVSPVPSYLEQVEQMVGVRFFLDKQQATAYTNPELLGSEVVTTYATTYIAGLRLLVAARRQFGMLPYQLDWQQRRDLRAEHHDEIITIRKRLSAAAPLVEESPQGIAAASTLRKEQCLSTGLFDRIIAELEPAQITFKRTSRSKTGELYYTAEDVTRIRAAVDAIGFATNNDLPVHGMAPQLKISLPRLYKLCGELGITIRKLRSNDHLGELTAHITKEEYHILGKHIISLEDATGLQSIPQIAARVGVTLKQVTRHISACKWDDRIIKKPQRTASGRIVQTFYLPEELAEAIIAELSAIVPYEYMTTSDYARLRGVSTDVVRKCIERERLPTHAIQIHLGSLMYLDGPTIYKLNCLIKKPEPAVDGWLSMKELEAEFDTSDQTIGQYLVQEYADVARPMFPRDISIKQFIPHYPPTFRAYLRTVIKPKGSSLEGHTGATAIAARRRMDSGALNAALSLRGLKSVEAINPSGNIEHYYRDVDLERVLPTLPQWRLPRDGVTLHEVALVNGMKLGTLSAQLSVSGVRRAGRYYINFDENPCRIGAYYSRAKLRAMGYALPPQIADPAFPRGEPPYGKYGPSRPAPVPPISLIPLKKLLATLPPSSRPTEEAALQFIKNNGGDTRYFQGRGHYVIGESAGLINYNFGREGVKPQSLGAGWLNREQLAARTSQTVEQIDHDLRTINWYAIRSELISVRFYPSEDNPRNRSAVHVLWHKPKDGKVILPHYNPAIVKHIEAIAEARRATAVAQDLHGEPSGETATSFSPSTSTS